MPNKKFRKSKKADEKAIPGISFLFYGKLAQAELGVLENSIKSLHRDIREKVKFYFTGPDADQIKSEHLLSIPGSTNIVPESLEPVDYLIILPAEGLSRNINFNALLSTDVLNQFPDQDSYSRIFFKDQSLKSPVSYVLGSDLVKYLKTLPSLKGLSFNKQLEWYLHRLNLRRGKLIIDHQNPFLSGIKKPFSFQPQIKNSFSWNFILPLKEHRTGTGFRVKNEKPLWRFAFALTALLIFFLLPVISYNAGISGDEEKHHLHAEKVYNYFKTDGADTLALHDPKYKLNYYGQSFDLFAYTFTKILNIEKIYETRHVLNGITGALAIIAAGILVRFIAGNFAGFITLIFMFFFPRFMGHAMNNPLDIPFAMGYIFSIYQMIRFLHKLPDFSIKHAIYLTLGIAFTTSIRIGGLLLIPYLFMFSGLYLVISRWPWKFLSGKYLRFAGKGILYISIISVVAYFLSILPWPYALQDPLKNPFNALNMMSNITVALRVMFEGEIIWSDNLPWYYVPKNMHITIPLVVLIFFVIPVILFLKKKKQINNYWLFMLYFVTIFPVLYIIYKESNVYGGWRHTLFIFPSFAGIASIGVNYLKNISKSKIYRSVFISLVILSLYHPIKHTFKNYPLQYIYFNELSGGVNKAYKKYETDYYLNSLKPATGWIKNYLLENPGDKENYTVISNAPYDIMRYYYRSHLDLIKFPYTRYYDRGAKDWDYAIFYCNYIDPYQLRRNIWPPKNTIHEIKVDDVTVCAIVKRENRNDYLGIQKLNASLSSQNLQEVNNALRLLESAVKYDPNNEIALLSLGRGYVSIQDYDNARKAMNRLLEIYPDYDKALNIIAFSYISEGETRSNPVLIDRAINILNKVISINYKFVDGYYNLGLAYFIKGDDNQALNYLNMAVEINGRHKRSYYLIANIFEKNGDHQRAMEILQYANSL